MKITDVTIILLFKKTTKKFWTCNNIPISFAMIEMIYLRHILISKRRISSVIQTHQIMKHRLVSRLNNTIRQKSHNICVRVATTSGVIQTLILLGSQMCQKQISSPSIHHQFDQYLKTFRKDPFAHHLKRINISKFFTKFWLLH